MLLFAALLFLLQQSSDEVTIEADRQERNGSIVRATGNVIATYQDFRFTADWIEYDVSSKRLTAGDRIGYRRLEESLDGDRADFDLATRSGTVTNASGMVAPGFHITAGSVTRREDGTYDFANARITSCDGTMPGWELRLARGSVRPGEGFTGRGTSFRFQRLPLLYLPYVTVPSSNRERSTGFLIPNTSTSTTKGRSVSEAFYYAIAPNADVMLTAEYFSKRGPAGKADFRLIPKANSRLEINSLFARDRLGQGGYSARIFNDYEFGQGNRVVADVNLVSSFLFRQVFEEGFNIISSPIEKSLAFLTRNTAFASYNLLYDRDGYFFTDQPTAVVRRAPSFDVGLPSRQLGRRLYFSMDAGWTAFARRDARLQTPSFVQRVDLYPALELRAIQTPAFEWTHRLAARETFYSHRNTTAVRRDPMNDLAVDYGFSFLGPRVEGRAARWSHSIEPTVDYRVIRGAGRFQDTIVVDDIDLYNNTHEVEYGVTQRLFGGHEVLSWRLAQKYFIDPGFGGAIVPGRRNVLAPLLDLTGFAFADGFRRFSPIVSTLRVSTTPNSSTDVQVNYDVAARQFRSAGIIGGANRGQAFTNIAYFFTRRSVTQVPSNQLRGTVGYGNFSKPGFSTALNFAYDIERSILQASTTQVSYNADCYGLSLEFLQFDIGARKESRFRFSFFLKNLGSFGTLRKQERLF